MRRSLFPAIAALASMAAGGNANAQGQCYEEIGCMSSGYMNERALRRLSCENLWYTRNRVFKDRGYCFKTSRAIEAFGNAGCRFDVEARVPFNTFERANIAAIRRVEQRKGC